MKTIVFWLTLFLFLGAGLLSAFDVPGKEEGATAAGAQVFDPKFLVEPSVETYSSAQGLVYSGGPWQDFLRETGPEWDISLDVRSNRPNLIQGRGIPWYPGVGNTLAWEDFASPTAAARPHLTGVMLKNLASAFIESHRDLMGVSTQALRFNPDKTVIFDDGAYASIGFDYLYKGVPVAGAEVFFRVNHGNLVQFGTILVSDVTLDTKPSVGKDAAATAVRRHFEDFGDPRLRVSAPLDFNFIDNGSLQIVPYLKDGAAGETFAGVPGSGYAHRLIWRFVVQVGTGIETWEVWVDAQNGKILECLDINRYVAVQDGVVQGGVYIVSNDVPEVAEPFPYCYVDNGGVNNLVTNAGGRYPYDSSSSADVQLDGEYARMLSTCGAINLSTNTPPGDLNFGMSPGSNCATPGFGGAGNTHSARTTFFHVNNIKAIARAYLPSNTWIDQNLTCRVDYNATCSSYYNGAIVLFKAGNGCSNTGELAGVICHETGHGLDANDGSGVSPDAGTGEAYADVVSTIESHESCIGNNFRPGVPCNFGCNLSCTGVRDIAVTPAVRPLNITGPPAECDRWICPYTGYMGPMGFEGHCESLIASGAFWDMAEALRTALGDGAGWARAESIWFQSVGSLGSAYQVVSGGQCNSNAVVNGCAANNWYPVFLAADDDDGNLSNGTPNGCRIWSAFNQHGIACGPRPACFSTCPILAAPLLSKNEEGHDQIRLSWTSVPGAATYVVFRNFTGCDHGFTPIAIVATTSYLDSDVTDGFDVFYAVQAVGANTSCRSPFSACITAMPGAGCLHCPKYDFGPFTPTTTYQTDTSAIAESCWKQYAFVLHAGSQYRFTFCEGGGAADFDTDLQLFNSSCVVVAENDNFCGLLSQLDFLPTATGTYYLRVKGTGTAFGNYTLAYANVAPACDGQLCPLYDYGTFAPTKTYQKASGEVIVGCYKTYRFQLGYNRLYRFTFCEGGGSAQFDTDLKLYDSSCKLVATNDDFCANRSQLDFLAPKNGYYYLKVTHKQGAQDGYTLAYKWQPPPV